MKGVFYKDFVNIGYEDALFCILDLIWLQLTYVLTTIAFWLQNDSLRLMY